MKKDGISKSIRLFYRPHLFNFLTTLKKYFELILYTDEDLSDCQRLIEAVETIQEKDDDKRNRNANNQVMTP